jgi:aspartate aminotransferase/aminotransferase
LTAVNPGDEVLFFDPYFVMYPHLVTLAGGVPVVVDTAPDYQIDLDRVRAALTPRTKLILVNSPANPTGAVVPRDTLRDLAVLARERGILLLSDEIYSAFSYDEPHGSPAEFDPDVVVFDGFSKTYGMTGWRLGYAHGPRGFIEVMTKLQQFTFVCAPSTAQHAGLAALDFDVAPFTADYRRKRDRMVEGLRGYYDMTHPAGAFYCYPRAPVGRTGSDFVAEAIRNNLLIIPGSTFSKHDTHFRISYAADDAMLDRGLEVLHRLAR